MFDTAMASEHREELDEGIFFNISTQSRKGGYSVSVENHLDEMVSFRIDLSNAKNLRFVDEDNQNIVSLHVKPLTISSIMAIARINPSLPDELIIDKSWEIEVYDSDAFADMNDGWDSTVEMMLSSSLNSSVLNPESSFTELCCIIEKDQGAYVDSDFPPYSNTLYNVTVNGKYKYLTYSRLEQFGTSWTLFQDDTIAVSDIALGHLPDTWLVTALASLCECPQLIRDLFPTEYITNSSSAHPIHMVYLYRDYEKVAVLVDGYFPCYLHGGPCYTHTISDSIWVLLVEKAFAKMLGGYGSLAQGNPNEALMDLTGVPAQSIRLDDAGVRRKLEGDDLWHMVMHHFERGSLLSITTGKEIEARVHLLAGHSFSVLKLFESNDGTRLVKVRDPWNLLEFISVWGRGSPMWTPHLRREAGATTAEYSDDVHWISFEALVERFYTLNILMIRRSGSKIMPYKEYKKPFEFVLNVKTSVPECPHFTLEPKVDSELIIVVQQEDCRCGRPYIEIGLVLLSTNSKKELRFVACQWISVERQNILHFRVLRGTTYVIVPLSTGVKFMQYLFEKKLLPPPPEELRRRAVIKVFCDEVFVVKARDFDALVYDKAVELALKSGTVIKAVKDKVELLYLKGGCAGVSYAARNIIDKPLQLNINFEDEETDMISHKGTLQTAETLDPGEFKVLHHIVPRSAVASLNTDWDCKPLKATASGDPTSRPSSLRPSSIAPPRAGVESALAPASPRASSPPSLSESAAAVSRPSGTNTAPVVKQSSAGCSCVLA